MHCLCVKRCQEQTVCGILAATDLKCDFAIFSGEAATDVRCSHVALGKADYLVSIPQRAAGSLTISPLQYGPKPDWAPPPADAHKRGPKGHQGPAGALQHLEDLCGA